MNDSLARIMDLTAMAVSVVAALLFTLKFYPKAKLRLRAIPFFFAAFGPMAILVHMVMHLIGVGFVASLKINAGTFSYDFRFYSLLLMAGVLGKLGYNLLYQTNTFFLQQRKSRKNLLATSGWIVLVAAPTIPFTFIGTLPVQAVIVSLIASLFVRKKALYPAQVQVLQKKPAEVSAL